MDGINDSRAIPCTMRDRNKTRISNRAPRSLAAMLVFAAQLIPHTAVARPAALLPADDFAGNTGTGTGDRDRSDRGGTDALPYIECVPFARQVSGIQLYGDAHTWWDQADGHYARGHVPQAGAVMSFRPFHAMTLGHVAMVSKVIDQRTVLLRHANWSPISGRRGTPELDVRAVDVSPANDWSEVRVWYAPIGDLGTTRWPVNGFIYKSGNSPRQRPLLIAANMTKTDNRQVRYDTPQMTLVSAQAAGESRIGNDFLDGIKPEAGTVIPRSVRPSSSASAPASLVHPARTYLLARATRPSAPVGARSDTTGSALRDDPIGRIIAARMGSTTD